jgi:hypothetical protein
MTMIDFDKPKYMRLKRLYEKAKADGKEVFLMDEHEILTDYAKYMLEYLAHHLKIKEDEQ